MQQLLTGFGAPHRRLPRPLLLFVGNVAAAVRGVRKLDEQADPPAFSSQMILLPKPPIHQQEMYLTCFAFPRVNSDGDQ